VGGVGGVGGGGVVGVKRLYEKLIINITGITMAIKLLRGVGKAGKAVRKMETTGAGRVDQLTTNGNSFFMANSRWGKWANGGGDRRHKSVHNASGICLMAPISLQRNKCITLRNPTKMF